MFVSSMTAENLSVAFIGRTKSKFSRRFCLRSPLSMPAIIISVTCGIVFPSLSQSQTLDQAILNQLFNDCGTLGINSSTPNVGSNLRAICTVIAMIPSANTSTGGAAASAPQSITASLNNRRDERLNEDREETMTTSTQTGSMDIYTGEQLSLFMSGTFESLNRDRTTFADGFDSHINGWSVGGDYRINNATLVGTTFIFKNVSGDYDGGGDFNTRSYGGTIYASFLPAPGFFIDILGGYNYNDYSVDRDATFVETDPGPPASIIRSGTLNSDTTGSEILGRAFVGYDHKMNNVILGPHVGLNYSYTHVKGYSEKGGGLSEVGSVVSPSTTGGGVAGIALKYGNEDVNSLQSTIGIHGASAISTKFGRLIPHVNADYIHEFMNNQRTINVRFAEDLRGNNAVSFGFQTDKPDRNWFNLSAGLRAVLRNGLQPFLNFRAIVGHNQFDNYAGTVGLLIPL